MIDYRSEVSIPSIISILYLSRMDMNGEISELVSAIDEFYSTDSEPRRIELNDYLCRFKNEKSSEVTIRKCFMLLNRSFSPSVQYFGALSLYDTIRERNEDILAKPELFEALKALLIKSLTEGASFQSQSLTNKLSSSLALLCLYSIPDIWQSPVQDLTAIWAATPELLLRVLAELSAEFSNVWMAPSQRNVLKTELHRVSDDMIRILSTVMQSPDSAPSLLNAAVECVEQWLRLPGSNLRQWTPLLSDVFGAVLDDSTALTNLLTILGSNDELVNEDQLVQHILQYICTTLSTKLLCELSRDALSEEVSALSAATCSLAEGVVSVLIRLSIPQSENSQSNSTQLLENLTLFFSRLSSFPGRYPMDERVSEMPHIFWTVLREEICSLRANDQEKAMRLIEAVRGTYAEVLRGAIDKLSYAPRSIQKEMNEEDIEAFENYRLNRSECALNAYEIVGGETLSFLNDRLSNPNIDGMRSEEECINLVESILYCWEQVADFINQNEYPQICQLLSIANNILSRGAQSEEECRLANTLMRVLYALSHLVSDHPEAESLELCCVSMVLHQLEVPRVTDEALKTLIKLIDDRPQWLLKREYSDSLIVRCSNLFQNESLSSKLRLSALKCIGISLSLREPNEIMATLQQPLEVYLAGLDGEAVDEIAERKRNFQIGMFSCLFTSLHNKQRPDGESVILLLRMASPILLMILEKTNDAQVADRICDAFRCACITLPPSRMAEFFPSFKSSVTLSLRSNPMAACNLAKSLVFSSAKVLPIEMVTAIEEWARSFDEGFPYDGMDEYILLLAQVLKKDWKLLDFVPEKGYCILVSSISLAHKAITASEDPAVVRCASQLLATIVSKISSHDHAIGRKILEERIDVIVKIVFRRVQIEMIRQTTDSLAEVLFFFVQSFTTQTRMVVSQEENGNSPMVSAMFRELGNLRNFKQMTLRLNHSARRDCA